MSNDSDNPIDPTNGADGQASKNAYEKQLDDIINKFFAIIPIIAYAQDLSYKKLFLVMLPILIILLKPILTKYIFKKYKSAANVYNTRYIYRFNKLSGYGRNEVYDHLESYLDQTLKAMSINHCYSDESEYNTYKAKFLLPYDQPMNLEWSGHKLIITKCLSDTLSGNTENKHKIPMIHIMTESSLEIIDKFLENVQETQRDIEQKKKKIKDQVMQYDCENKSWKPRPIKIKKNFANTFLKEEDLELVKRSIKYFSESEDHYDNRGIPYKISYLLYGKPGCGKTSFIYAVSRETGRNIYLIPRISDEDKLRTALTLIPDGSLVVAEEIDTIEALKPRDPSQKIPIEFTEMKGPSLFGFMPTGPTKSSVDSNSDGSEDSDDNSSVDANATILKNTKKKKHTSKTSPKMEYESLNSFFKEKLKIYLDVLDGYDYFRNCIIIMTTNYLNDIDEAVYRPGRVDHKIEFTFADQFQIKNIFKVFYDLDLDQENLDKMAKMNKTTSYIINTAINPNLKEPQRAIDIILEHTPF
jgi:chaperone BCS1